MRKAIVYIAVSLDGFIADKKGGVGWLVGDGSDPANPGSYPDFVEGVDTVLLGYTTYHQIVSELSPNAWPYDGKETYVLTHRSLPNKPGIAFVNEEVGSLLGRLKKQTGKSVWICGGASLVNQALAAKQVDEIVVSVMPVLLGDGVRLFEPGDIGTKLALSSAKPYNGVVDLDYRVIG